MSPEPHELSRMGETKLFATYLAMVVRNAMEKFHSAHLSDEQMAELNPIIRNAIYTGLYAHETRKQSDRSSRFIDEHLRAIPPYWEEPAFLPGFRE